MTDEATPRSETTPVRLGRPINNASSSTVEHAAPYVPHTKGRTGFQMSRWRALRSSGSVLLASLVLFFAANAGAQVTLGWNASTSPYVTGYSLHDGTTSGNLTNSINAGNITSYTMTGLSAGTTYYFAVVAYDGAGDQSADSNEINYTVPPAVQTFTITASAGPGGTISPTGSTTVTYGASQAYAITPANGYTISTVTVDGSPVGAVSSYTFGSVKANHTIAASFATLATVPLNPYTLTLTETGTGTGSVSTSPGGTTFASGTSVTLTETVNAGSTFAGWSGACSGTGQTCQVVMNDNMSVGAAFDVDNPAVAASSDPATSSQANQASTPAAADAGGGGGGGCFIATAAFRLLPPPLREDPEVIQRRLSHDQCCRKIVREMVLRRIARHSRQDTWKRDLEGRSAPAARSIHRVQLSLSRDGARTHHILYVPFSASSCGSGEGAFGRILRGVEMILDLEPKAA